MSDFKKHNWYAIGASGWVFASTFYFGSKFEVSLILSLAIYLGANFPDLDTASIPSMWAARFSIVASVYFIYAEKPLYAAIVGIIYAAPKVGKHRGWTHKYITLFVITAVVFYFWKRHLLIANAFCTGLLIHYYIDKISPFERKNWI